MESGASHLPTCLTCQLNKGEGQAPGGVIFQDAMWRLEHVIEPIPMVGWLILKPLRHVEQFADLSSEEAQVFGPLCRRISQAMSQVLRPEKVYLSLYAEAPGFAHLHVHLIPRFGDTPPARRGPNVFEYLAESSTSKRNLAPVEDAARAASSIRELLVEQV